jgi:Na+-translocating ferredoxin:NAD+ oxidoreductase subunit A
MENFGDSLIQLFQIILAAILVQNVVFNQFLGICPYLGVSKKIDTAVGMGGAVVFVMVLATAATWPLFQFVLNRTYEFQGHEFNLAYLQTIVFILIIASLVQLVEIIMKKASPVLYRALGIFLPLITTNCAILGVALLAVRPDKDLGFLQAVVYAFASGLGFTLALVIFAGIRERLTLTNVPKSMQGTPIGLITAGILALAFMGFSGLGG